MTIASLEMSTLFGRWDHLRQRLRNHGDPALVITGGADMSYLCGYDIKPMERITALVVAGDAHPTLVVPELERARVHPQPELFAVETWGDTDDPMQRIADLCAQMSTVVVTDNMWAAHALSLHQHLRKIGSAELRSIGDELGGLRSIKSLGEVAAMATVGGLADRVATQLQRGEIDLVGRTERDVAQDISERLVVVGHETVEFVIVASGPNSASPHHHPSDRVIQAEELVLFDFGGKYNGYCSDTTRCVFTGEIPSDVATAYAVLREAQQAGVEAARAGDLLCSVDLAARSVIAAAGYGNYFVHRTGHGIGTEVHEPPYVTATNQDPIEVGHVFSIEPGIYIDGKWGMRLEDIVAVTADGPNRCNTSDHRLVSLL